jgi:hypothetical protein
MLSGFITVSSRHPTLGRAKHVPITGDTAVESEDPKILLERCAQTGSIARWNAWRQANPSWVIHLTGIQLGAADLHEVDLHGADLRDAHLAGANLRGANLQGADLRGASLERADLRGATLTRARLRRTRLDDADLREVLWDLPAYVRSLPRWVLLLALVSIGTLPGYLLLVSLRTLLQGDLVSANHVLLILAVFVISPLAALFLWALVRFVLMIPFDLYLILKTLVRRFRQREGCLGIMEAPVLVMLILIDAASPFPFIGTFDPVMAETLSHRDAVVTMRVKVVTSYLALVVLNLLVLADLRQFTNSIPTLR